MKFKTIISRDRDEEVIIYAHEKTNTIEKIEDFISGVDTELIGYGESKSIKKLHAADIECFTVEDGRVYALTSREKLQIRKRLYEIEELLDDSFVKLNQSCIGNVEKMERFDASLGGSLMVTFKCGHRDYVSRRQLKTVKERIGFKL